MSDKNYIPTFELIGGIASIGLGFGFHWFLQEMNKSIEEYNSIPEYNVKSINFRFRQEAEKSIDPYEKIFVRGKIFSADGFSSKFIPDVKLIYQKIEQKSIEESSDGKKKESSKENPDKYLSNFKLLDISDGKEFINVNSLKSADFSSVLKKIDSQVSREKQAVKENYMTTYITVSHYHTEFGISNLSEATILGYASFNKKSNVVEFDRPQKIVKSKSDLIAKMEWETVLFKVMTGSFYFLGTALTVDSVRRFFQNRNDKK